MAANSTEEEGVPLPKIYQGKETSPATTKIQIQLQPKSQKKVAVVYYLSRNGQLEHPHFMEVPLSSAQGLYLRDVINTLSQLRGQGMASMYSWALKRSYKNGFLWQDLSDDDLIHPSHGQDYILKGSLLLETSLSFRSIDSISSSTSRRSSEMINSISEDSGSLLARRKNYSWSSTDDIGENKVYKAKASCELSRTGSNVSTQTDNIPKVKSEMEEPEPEGLGAIKPKEISTPSLSFNEVHSSGNNVRYQKVARDHYTDKSKEPKLVMKLIGCGCGSKRFNDFKMKNKY